MNNYINAKKKTETLIIRIDPELKLYLKKLADADNRTLSDFVCLCLKSLMEDAKSE